jgi:hypothetical protein
LALLLLTTPAATLALVVRRSHTTIVPRSSASSSRAARRHEPRHDRVPVVRVNVAVLSSSVEESDPHQTPQKSIAPIGCQPSSAAPAQQQRATRRATSNGTAFNATYVL